MAAPVTETPRGTTTATGRPESAAVGDAERSTDEPDSLGLRAINERLSVVGDTLSKLGSYLGHWSGEWPLCYL